MLVIPEKIQDDLIDLLSAMLWERWTLHPVGLHRQVYINNEGQRVLYLELQKGEVQENPNPLTHHLLCDIVTERSTFGGEVTEDQAELYEYDEAESYNIAQYMADFIASVNFVNTTPFPVIMPDLMDYKKGEAVQ